MNIQKVLPIALFTVLLLALAPTSRVQADYGEGVTDHCDTPTEFVTIVASPSGQDTDLSFNSTEIEMSANTCVQITFINNAPTMEHDFVINSVPGADGINFVDIHLLNSTDGEYGNGTAFFNIQTNDPNIFEYYCSIDNHEEKGMNGTLIVGNPDTGSSSQNQLTSTGILSAGFISVIAILVTRRNNH